MDKRYILEVDKKKLRYVTDMLRYDNCFRVDRGNDDTLFVHTLNFTPERWRSFGYVPNVKLESGVLASQYRQYIYEAVGFTEGLRFAYAMMKEIGEIIPLVEGS